MNNKSNKIVKLLGFILLVSSLVYFYFQGTQEQTFTNASISNQILEIKSPAIGSVYSLNVNRGDWVSKGSTLMNVGDGFSDINVERHIELTRHAIKNAIKGCLDLKVLEKQLQQSRLELTKIQAEVRRKQQLVQSGLISAEIMTNLQFELEKLQLQVDIQSNLLKKEKYDYRLPFKQRTDLQLVIADLKQAFYQQHLNEIKAPTDGYVYGINTFEGEYVSEEQLLMLFIPKDGSIIEANVLESQIGLLAEGDPVEIIADAFPEYVMQGHVYSIVPSTASSFSSLPRNNIDSNWTKISQRIPVIFKLNSDDKSRPILPVGGSVTVKIKRPNQRSKIIKAPFKPKSKLNTQVKPLWEAKFEQSLEQIFEQTLDEKIIVQCQQ